MSRLRAKSLSAAPREVGFDGIDLVDGRNIEVVVTGLLIAHGIPVAIDVIIISVLYADGTI